MSSKVRSIEREIQRRQEAGQTITIPIGDLVDDEGGMNSLTALITLLSEKLPPALGLKLSRAYKAVKGEVETYEERRKQSLGEIGTLPAFRLTEAVSEKATEIPITPLKHGVDPGFVVIEGQAVRLTQRAEAGDLVLHVRPTPTAFAKDLEGEAANFQLSPAAREKWKVEVEKMKEVEVTLPVAKISIKEFREDIPGLIQLHLLWLLTD